VTTTDRPVTRVGERDRYPARRLEQREPIPAEALDEVVDKLHRGDHIDATHVVGSTVKVP